jgi:hypothetical protein
MTDSLRHSEKFSEAAILKLTQRMMDNIPPAIFRSVNNVDILISFDNVIEKLLQRIDFCKNQILISTRTCPEILLTKYLSTHPSESVQSCD